MYQRGEGVEQDYSEAVRWFRLAAEQGDPDAQYNLATMYDQGRGVPQDPAAAMKWWRLAAEQGHLAARIAVDWRE
jgi:TPR repeat protein